MNTLVTLNTDNTIKTTSKVIADTFGKGHREVLKAIRKIIGEVDTDFGESNFALSSYKSEQNKALPCYELSRDGFSLLAMGFVGSAATQWKVKYITAFNQMESTLIQVNQLTHSVSAVEQLEEAQAQDQLTEIQENALKRRIRNRLDIANMLGQSFDINEFLINDKSALPADVVMGMKLTMGAEIATYGSLSLPRKSLGALLEEHGVDMSAAKFNSEVLQPLGLIDDSRTITAKGNHFGSNDPASSVKGTTHPRWFISRFPELLEYVKTNTDLI